MKDFSFAILREVNFRMVDNYFDLGRTSFSEISSRKRGLSCTNYCRMAKKPFQ
jgi:hypothetical protein